MFGFSVLFKRDVLVVGVVGCVFFMKLWLGMCCCVYYWWFGFFFGRNVGGFCFGFGCCVLEGEFVVVLVENEMFDCVGVF